MASRALLRQCAKNFGNKCHGSSRSLSTSTVQYVDKKDKSVAGKVPIKASYKNSLDIWQPDIDKGLIPEPEIVDVGLVSGVPEEHIKTRRVRIYQPAKSAMQSGTNNINFWQIDFDTRERWENPLIGWTSTGDPMSNVKVDFATIDEAILHCQKMGWDYYVQQPNKNQPKPRNYGANFAWNKRTRVSTK